MAAEILVSIITPVYNAEKFILDTIACVKAQTVAEWELLLAEDGSTDGTRKLLETYLKQEPDDRIRLLPGDSNGAAAARNRALDAARGRYIAYLDADDVWQKDKLKKQLDFLEEKKVPFSYTDYEFGDSQAKPTGKLVHVPPTLTYRQALRNTTIFTSTVMFDTALIPKKELYMPQVKSEDSALWFSVLRKGYPCAGLNENLTLYRRPSNSLSANKFKAIARIWNLYRKQEKLSVFSSACNLFFWAFRAVKRRL